MKIDIPIEKIPTEKMILYSITGIAIIEGLKYIANTKSGSELISGALETIEGELKKNAC